MIVPEFRIATQSTSAVFRPALKRDVIDRRHEDQSALSRHGSIFGGCVGPPRTSRPLKSTPCLRGFTPVTSVV